MRRLMLIAVAVLLLLSASSLSAQTARLKGTITDSQGAVVPQVNIRVLQANKVVKEGKTNEVGEFDLEVAPGDYQFEASYPDFTLHKQTVRVVADMPPMSVAMTLKPVAEVVEVEANP